MKKLPTTRLPVTKAVEELRSLVDRINLEAELYNESLDLHLKLLSLLWDKPPDERLRMAKEKAFERFERRYKQFMRG